MFQKTSVGTCGSTANVNYRAAMIKLLESKLKSLHNQQRIMRPLTDLGLLRLELRCLLASGTLETMLPDDYRCRGPKQLQRLCVRVADHVFRTAGHPENRPASGGAAAAPPVIGKGKDRAALIAVGVAPTEIPVAGISPELVSLLLGQNKLPAGSTTPHPSRRTKTEHCSFIVSQRRLFEWRRHQP